MRTAAIVLGWSLATLAVLLGAFVVSFRTGFRPVLSLIRRLNRAVTNPRQMRTAGSPGASAGVVHHVGRRSGAQYATPVGVQRTAAGVLVLLPYGSGTDWVRNLLAAGDATVEHEGDTFAIVDPRIVDRRAVHSLLPRGDRRVATLFGIDEFLVADRAEVGVRGG